METQQQKVLVVTETSGLDHSVQDPCEIAQIDISMLLPNFPGPMFPLFGARLSFQTNHKNSSQPEQADILFRACSLSVFDEALDMIQCLKRAQKPDRQAALLSPYQTQTVDVSCARKIFLHQKRQILRHPFQASRILNPEWEEFDCKYHCR